MNVIRPQALLAALLFGLTLLLSATPASADRKHHRSYDSSRHNVHVHHHHKHYHRGKSSHSRKHAKRKSRDIVHHHRYAPPRSARHYSRRSSSHSGVVVHLPPVVIQLR